MLQGLTWRLLLYCLAEVLIADPRQASSLSKATIRSTRWHLLCARYAVGYFDCHDARSLRYFSVHSAG